MKRLPLDTDYLIQKYLAGKSEYELANELCVGRPAIHKRLMEANVKIRSHSEAGLLRASKMTPIERQRQATAAHKAATGRIKTLEEQCMAARTRQTICKQSPYEIAFSEMLVIRNIPTIPQFAIGPYNCDLAAEPVAMEIYGGGWHWSGDHLARVPKRFRYLLDSGWHILVIALNWRYPLSPASADYAAAFIQTARSDPSQGREYRVILGTGELITSGSAEDDNISIKPPFTRGHNSIGQYTRISK
ncbi:MAG TPA: hypothetical protein VI776_07155 [Anaerolineales bacterium]|nr:hypothetical protein [Anaerolineales bacterium]